MTTLPIEIIDIIMGYEGTTKNRNGRYIKQLVIDEAIYENMFRIRVLIDRIITERDNIITERDNIILGFDNIILGYDEGMSQIYTQDEILRLFYDILVHCRKNVKTTHVLLVG